MKLRVTRFGVDPSYTIERATGAPWCNVWLFKNGRIYPLRDGNAEFDVGVRVVPGVAWWPGLEDDIRRRFESWWAVANADDN